MDIKEDLMDQIKQREDVVRRAWMDWFVTWLERNGYNQAAEQFDKEFCDED